MWKRVFHFFLVNIMIILSTHPFPPSSVPPTLFFQGQGAEPQAGMDLDWSPVFILSRIETGSGHTIQGISLGMLCQRCTATLRESHANVMLRRVSAHTSAIQISLEIITYGRPSSHARSKLNLPQKWQTERPVSGIIHTSCLPRYARQTARGEGGG